MESQKRQEILETLTELGKTCKGCINELETEIKRPLVIRYIKLDDDIVSILDNAGSGHTSRCLDFAYSALKSLLFAKYTSDNLSISYKDKRLKLVYNIDGLNVTTVL